MLRALTAQQMRELDRAAEREGMPAAVLMENAGDAVAREALLLGSPRGAFYVVCGRGNNGGDGLVAARKLLALGRRVVVELVCPVESLEGEARRNAKALLASGGSIGPVEGEAHADVGDVVIDALLGTGLSRAPEGAYPAAIGRVLARRALGAKVLAVDLPSGLSSDTGQALGACVRADLTVTFAAAKVGQLLEPGASLCGELRCVDIGIPQAAWSVVSGRSVRLTEEGDVAGRLPRRDQSAHKGTFGHVLVVAGSRGRTGAAALAGLGALRGGAGLVTVATRPEALEPVLAHAPELMGLSLTGEGALGPSDLNTLLEAADEKDALVIGPGIPRAGETGRLIGMLLEELSVPVVLDADALNALAGDLDALARAKAPLILTPHPGEMARLLGQTAAEVQRDRVSAGRALAEAGRCWVVLKGARTLVVEPSGDVWVNPTGNPGMATGGSGDVLAGLCGALLAQGLSPLDASLLSVYAHGLAGDLVSRRTGQAGLIAGDLVAGLGEVWTRWRR